MQSETRTSGPSNPEVVHGEYRKLEYLQWSSGSWLRGLQSLIGICLWPIVLPMVLLSKVSEILFRTMSELLSVVPYFPGVIMRYEFYRFALESCGKNVLIESGTMFIHPDIKIGSNVLIGRYNIIHHCDFGDHVLIGERCTFLSGSRQHAFERTDIPMALQGGFKKRIRVDDDCWIGSHSVVAEDVGSGSIVGAGSIVVKPLPPQSKIRPASMVRSDR